MDQALNLLLAEYKKQMTIYLSDKLSQQAQDKQYEKCLIISNCCTTLGMTDKKDKEIIKEVRSELGLND